MCYCLEAMERHRNQLGTEPRSWQLVGKCSALFPPWLIQLMEISRNAGPGKALRTLGQEDHRFKACLGSNVSSDLTGATE